MKGGHFKIPACCLMASSHRRLRHVFLRHISVDRRPTLPDQSNKRQWSVHFKAPRKAAHKINSFLKFISKSSTRAFDKFPFNPSTLNYRQDASRGRRYQEVHRDLPSEGRLLRADQEEQADQQHQVQGPLPEAPLHLGSQGHRQGREAQAEPSPQPATHRCLQEGQEVCLRRWLNKGFTMGVGGFHRHEWASRDTLHFIMCSERRILG